MSLIQSIREFDRKFAWSFLGVTLTLIFGAIAIYTEFFADRDPHLQYEVLASVPVLDVREDVGKLSILFDGTDIRKQKESLHVITVRVINDSRKDILKEYYDEQEPLGINAPVGKIIRADLVAASNPYLEKHVTARSSGDDTVLFPQVILDAREFFVLKLLVLHPEDTEPEIRATGKIAGIRTVPVVQLYKRKDTQSLLSRTFTGDVFVQGLRLVSYTVGLVGILLVILLLGGVGEHVWKALARRRRRKLVEEFQRKVKIALQPEDQWMLGHFSQYGAQMVHLAVHLSPSWTPKALEYAAKGSDAANLTDLERRAADQLRKYHEWYFRAGLIRKTAEGLAVDERGRTVLQEFGAFLVEKGAVPARYGDIAQALTPTGQK